MKKAISAILMILLLFSMTACGESPSTVPPATSAPPATAALPATSAPPAETPAENAAPASSVPVSDDEMPAEATHSEIIMGTVELNGKYIYKIYAIDPDTGGSRLISEFNIPVSVTRTDNSEWQYYPTATIDHNSQMPLKTMFSRNYKYLALTAWSPKMGGWRAGFYSEDFYYTDVTQLTGAVGGDFDAPPKQVAIGFTDNDQFIYADTNDSWGNNGIEYYWDNFTTYQVEVFGVNNVGSSQPYNELGDFILTSDNWNWMGKYWELTDRIDDTHYLINYPESFRYEGYANRWGVRIYDTETQELTSFIPGESRSNWSGIISPDKESIAFLSAPAEGTGNVALYITSVDGGEPVKVLDDITLGRSRTGEILTRPIGQYLGGASVCFLLEWRQAA